MTPQEAKQKLINEGVTAVDFAKRHGFNYRQVVQVLNGRNKGRYGEAHHIAVALGLKGDAA